MNTPRSWWKKGSFKEDTNMRILIESLKRMYENEKITKEQLQKRVEKNVIAIEEYNYIVGIEE